MSDHDHANSNYSPFDHDYASPHEDWGTPVSGDRWDSPYIPGTVSGDAHRWWASDQSDSRYARQQAPGPASPKAFVFAVTAMLGFGIAGAVILSLIF